MVDRTERFTEITRPLPGGECSLTELKDRSNPVCLKHQKLSSSQGWERLSKNKFKRGF
jgi:hypothetical protein